MRFKGLDLNLLVALDVLLETRNVSRTAERLHLSQPAVSAALARLRAYFDDPLLVATGKRMVPTAHALTLLPRLRQLLTEADALVSLTAQFVPETATRRFRIGTSDFITTVVLTPLLRRLATIAPGVALEIVPPSDSLMAALDRGEFDLAIVPQEHLSQGHPTELLFEERYVAVGWSGNPLMSQGLDRAGFEAAGHIGVEIGQTFRASFAEINLRLLAIERRIDVMVSSFTMVPGLLVGTGRLAVMHERLARAMAANYAIVHAELPFPFPVMREMAQFHRSRTDDAGLAWLLDEIRRELAITKTDSKP